MAAGSSDPALAATTSTLAASDCAFRRLGDVRRALSASSMGSFILIALVVTVQTAQHGLAVLLSVGPSGVDLPGAAYAPESRDSMLKRVEKQSNAFLGAESATFLACEDANDSHTLRCYACPYELDAFLALKTGAQWVADTTALKQCTYDKDNPAHQLIFAPVSALRDLSCERLCLEAMSAVDTMRSSACVPLDLAPLETQNGGDSSPGTTKPRETTSAAWTLRMRQHEASQKLVRLQLRVAARRQHQRGLEADADELVASADRVGNNKVTDINAIPLELRGHDDAIANDKWRHARFSPVLEAPVTNALLKPTPQPQITWRPATIEDLFMPGVWAKVAAWCEGNAKDLLWMREHGADGKRPHKQQPLVLAQSDLVPEARGVVWDLRRASDGVIEPWDFAAPITSDLNLDFLEVLLSTCPDRELVSHLRHGVDFKADLPLQTVLMPHLNSIAKNVDLCEREIDRLRGKGWSTAFSMLPALPCRLLPCGSVERKYEPGRPRRTLNASAPHKAYYDADGILVVPLNTAIKRDSRASTDTRAAMTVGDGDNPPSPQRGVVVPAREHAPSAGRVTWEDWRAQCALQGKNPLSAEDRPPHLQPSSNKWPKELKPLVLSKLHDISVLRHAALIFGEEVVGMSTDFADYFSQLSLSPSVLWMHVVHWAGLEGCSDSSLGSFVLDERLGFGASASSNIGQRLSHSLNSVFRQVFDAQEAKVLAAITDPKQIAFLDDRRALGLNQCRLYEICTYTDDPFLVCVGAERLARAVALWNRMLKAIGIAVAIPVKRQFGAAVRWLGLDFFLSLGVVVVPENKRLRALTSMMAMAAGTPTTFSAYQAATSFLQYLKPFIAGADGTYFYGLYEPYSRGAHGQQPNPADIVTMTPTIREQAQRWVALLRSTAGIFASSVLTPLAPAVATPLLYLYSDAALEGAAVPGLGGYMHGFYWELALHGDELLLPISVLELIAIGINLIVFASLAHGARVHLCSDSLNSVQVLTNLRAKSQLMARVHRNILQLPQSATLGGSTAAVHCFGSANPLADAVSRGNKDYFHALCAQLGVAPVQLPVSPTGCELLADALDFARSNGLLKVPDVARTAAQLAMEHGFGSEFSSDVTGDGPRSPRGCLHPPTCTDTLTSVRTPLLHNRTPVRSGTSASAPPALHPQTPIPPRARVPSPWVSACGARLPRSVPPRATVHSPPTRASAIDSTLTATAHACPLMAPIAVPQRAQVQELPKVAVNEAGATGAFSRCNYFTPSNAQQATILQPVSGALRSVHHSNMGVTTCAAATVRPSSFWGHTRGAAPSLRSVTKTYRPHWAQVQTMPHSPTQQTTSRRRALRLNALHDQTTNMVKLLENDQSHLALRPKDPQALHHLCFATLAAADSAPASSTTKTDDLAWERWCWYCETMNTPPLRDNTAVSPASSASVTARETALLCGFLLYLADSMPGRGGNASAKPQSNFQMVLAVRRIHERMGARMEVLHGVRKVYDSLIKTFVATHGPDELVPARKEPLDGPRLERLFSLPNGTTLGSRTVDWDSAYWVAWRAMLSCGFAAAFRKAELLPAPNTTAGPCDLTRASISWIIGGVAVADPSAEQLASLASGDYCVIKPPTSKADPFGLHFTTKPIYLPFADNLGNAARNVATLVTAVPISTDQRPSVPLFSFNAGGVAMGHAEASHVLQHALKAAFPLADSSRWSMHSLRIGAATALMKAGASMELIQALCRWRSPKSVNIYARLGARDYGTWLLRAQTQHADSSTTRNLPRFDYDGIIEALSGAVDA